MFFLLRAQSSSSAVTPQQRGMGLTTQGGPAKWCLWEISGSLDLHFASNWDLVLGFAPRLRSGCAKGRRGMHWFALGQLICVTEQEMWTPGSPQAGGSAAEVGAVQTGPGAAAFPPPALVSALHCSRKAPTARRWQLRRNWGACPKLSSFLKQGRGQRLESSLQTPVLLNLFTVLSLW